MLFDALVVLTLENCLASPNTIIFFARKIAGKACAIDTCDASSMIMRSNSSGASGMYSA